MFKDAYIIQDFYSSSKSVSIFKSNILINSIKYTQNRY